MLCDIEICDFASYDAETTRLLFAAELQGASDAERRELARSREEARQAALAEIYGPQEC